MAELNDEIERMKLVDLHPDSQRATEADEEQVLRGLYGDPTEGIYTGGEA